MSVSTWNIDEFFDSKGPDGVVFNHFVQQRMIVVPGVGEGDVSMQDGLHLSSDGASSSHNSINSYYFMRFPPWKLTSWNQEMYRKCIDNKWT